MPREILDVDTGVHHAVGRATKVLGSLLMCLGVVAAVGCQKPRSRCRVYIANDVSGSRSEAERRQSWAIATLIADDFEGSVDLTVWNYSLTSQKIFAGRPYGQEDVVLLLEPLIAGLPEPGHGTHQAAALTAIARDLELPGDRLPAAALILTDGEDFKSSATEAAAEALCSLPLESVLVGPVLPELRGGLERSLSPLGRRAIVAADVDFEYGLEATRETLAELLRRDGGGS